MVVFELHHRGQVHVDERGGRKLLWALVRQNAKKYAASMGSSRRYGDKPCRRWILIRDIVNQFLDLGGVVDDNGKCYGREEVTTDEELDWLAEQLRDRIRKRFVYYQSVGDIKEDLRMYEETVEEYTVGKAVEYKGKVHHVGDWSSEQTLVDCDYLFSDQEGYEKGCHVMDEEEESIAQGDSIDTPPEEPSDGVSDGTISVDEIESGADDDEIKLDDSWPEGTNCEDTDEIREQEEKTKSREELLKTWKASKMVADAEELCRGTNVGDDWQSKIPTPHIVAKIEYLRRSRRIQSLRERAVRARKDWLEKNAIDKSTEMGITKNASPSARILHKERLHRSNTWRSPKRGPRYVRGQVRQLLKLRDFRKLLGIVPPRLKWERLANSPSQITRIGQLIFLMILTPLTKDEDVYTAVERLKEKKLYTAEQLAVAKISTIKRMIASLGLHKKAKYLRDSARMIVRRGKKILEPNPEWMLRLPGMGDKTVAAVMYAAYGITWKIPVDSHLFAIFRALHWCDCDDKTEGAVGNTVMKWLPRSCWYLVNEELAGLGQLLNRGGVEKEQLLLASWMDPEVRDLLKTICASAHYEKENGKYFST